MAKNLSGKFTRPTGTGLGREPVPPRESNFEAPAIPVVGIGASAGGIEALCSFFNAMPADSGCAFVVVLHLDPKRESEMAHILSARTKMPVAQVTDGMRLRSTMCM